MNRIEIISLWIFSLLQMFVNAQSKDELVIKFFHFTNTYQKDSLDMLLTDDFELSRTYTSYKNDKNSFLNNYLDYSKNLKGKFTLMNEIHTSENTLYVAVDSSLLYTLLEIPNPIWKFSITTQANHISKIQIDTSVSYSNYVSELMKKNNQFESWLLLNYPNYSKINISSTGKQYIEKLMEYSNYMKKNVNKEKHGKDL